MSKRRHASVASIGCLILLLLLIGLLAIAFNGPGKRPISEYKQIEISQPRLQHLIERHTVGGAQNAGKSVFNGGEDLVKLINDAGNCTPVPQANGNLQRVVDAGRPIGIDRRTGRPTSTYTVITDPSGGLVTAFPGAP